MRPSTAAARTTTPSRSPHPQRIPPSSVHGGSYDPTVSPMRTPPPTGRTLLPASSSSPNPARQMGSRPMSASASSGHTSSADKLGSVRANLAALSSTLRQDLEAKREFEENRVYEMKEVTSKIEQHLALEVKARTESDKALENMMEHKLKTLVETVDRKCNDRLVVLQHNIDIISKKLDRVVTEVAEERDKTTALTMELRSQYHSGLQEIRQGVEHEKSQRLEKEAAMVKKLTEDVLRLQESMDFERKTRDTSLQNCFEELQRITHAVTPEGRIQEKFYARVADDILSLKAGIRRATELREQGAESLTAAMELLVQEVQVGLNLTQR
eukprot:PhF_6_TR12955/c0_g1_i2/m.20454